GCAIASLRRDSVQRDPARVRGLILRALERHACLGTETFRLKECQIPGRQRVPIEAREPSAEMRVLRGECRPAAGSNEKSCSPPRSRAGTARFNPQAQRNGLAARILGSSRSTRPLVRSARSVLRSARSVVLSIRTVAVHFLPAAALPGGVVL